MRPALTAFLPMLAAAGVILVGGERLARTHTEERIPADRERLLDFAAELDSELERLDRLFRSHLERLALFALEPSGNDPATEARKVHALLAICPVTTAGPREVVNLTPPGPGGPRLPEFVVEDRGKPLNPDNAVVFSKRLLEASFSGDHGWLAAPDPDQKIFWTRPEAGRLVAFVIDAPRLQEVTASHLEEWIATPLAPLREASELFALRGPAGWKLTSMDSGKQGPAALLMPFRTGLGEWEIQAWDRVTVLAGHDSATLIGSAALASVLALGGLLLWHQQRRALRLAEERVSFVNRVSHELGTPLTNVALNLDLATESLETQPAESRHRLGIVTEEIERLGRLVANVLTFSRRERRALSLDPRPCVPDEIIGQTLDSFRPALRRRDIAIDWTPNSPIRSLLDPDALGQIVGNLISNVEKYAADGQWLGIESRMDGESLVVRVLDHGPGVPASSRARIFQPFERVHRSVNEGASGTGLGLTIARELATRMGGSLKLIDVEQGACFELRVPAPAALKLLPLDNSSAA